MFAHVIAVFVALKNGLGSSSAMQFDQPTDTAQVGTGGRATLAADMFFLMALALAKCSVILFIQRLLSRELKWLFLACYGLCVIFILWGIASMIALGAMCNGPEYVADGLLERCGDQVSLFAKISSAALTPSLERTMGLYYCIRRDHRDSSTRHAFRDRSAASNVDQAQAASVIGLLLPSRVSHFLQSA